MGETINIRWKCFSLEQAHSSKGGDFKLWDHSDVANRSLKPLQAAKCAQLQGNDLFDTFHMLLFEALHQRKKDIKSEAVLKSIAGEAHLDVPKFMEDLKSDVSSRWVFEDHIEAVKEYDVFGVPTLVFNGEYASFVKLGSLPDSLEKQVQLFEEIKDLITDKPHILEIKRP